MERGASMDVYVARLKIFTIGFRDINKYGAGADVQATYRGVMPDWGPPVFLNSPLKSIKSI